MFEGQKVGVVIPALDEEAGIALVLADMPGWVDVVVVADNGSLDATASLAAQAGARVVSEPRRGYGRACLTGLAALPEVEVVVFLDGDHSDHPEQMDRLVGPIAGGQADMVIGSRALGQAQPGALSVPQRWGNWLACRLMRLIWRANYTDLGPFRAISKAALKSLAMADENYGWTVEMQIKAARQGLRYQEAPVDYRRRIGRSHISGTVKGVVLAGAKIIYTIARYALQR